MSSLSRILLMALSAATLTGNIATAQNRDSTPIFDQPPTNGMTQVFLGLGDLILSAAVHPGWTPERKLIFSAEMNLRFAQDLPLSEQQRQRTEDAILANRANFDSESDIGQESELKDSAAKRLENVRKAELVTSKEKQRIVEAAEKALTSARQDAITIAKSTGLLPKAVRVVRYTGSAILILDMVGRIYVWNALEANPTFSPAAQVLIHYFSK